MNDAAPGEPFSQRAAVALRRRLFPLRPTSIFRRELVAQFQLLLIFMTLQICSWFLYFLFALGATELGTMDTAELGIFLPVGFLLGVSLVIGSAAGAEEDRSRRHHFSHHLPVRPARILLEKGLAMGTLLAVWSFLSFGLFLLVWTFARVSETYVFFDPSLSLGLLDVIVGFLFELMPLCFAYLTTSFALGTLIGRPLVTAVLSFFLAPYALGLVNAFAGFEPAFTGGFGLIALASLGIAFLLYHRMEGR